MAAQRGYWVKEGDVGKYIRADWRAGSFIRSEFSFNACIKHGRSHLYNKKALQKLGQELMARNIDLHDIWSTSVVNLNFKRKFLQIRN